MYNSVAVFHTWNSVPLNSNSIPLVPQPLATTFLLSVSLNTLGTSSEWGHTLFVFLKLT